MNLLRLAPKELWIGLAGSVCTLMVVFTAYSKGVESERNRQELVQKAHIEEQVAKGLEEAHMALEVALNFQKEREGIVTQLNQQLDDSRSQSSKLQEQLNDILTLPPTECDTLPEPYIRLYKEMYSKGPAN